MEILMTVVDWMKCLPMRLGCFMFGHRYDIEVVTIPENETYKECVLCGAWKHVGHDS